MLAPLTPEVMVGIAAPGQDQAVAASENVMPANSIYLLLAVVGAVIPYAFFLDYFASEGIGAGFVAALFANGAAGGFTADLLISSVAFWLWMAADTRDRGTGRIWPFVALNLTIGLSCALPAYLWQRGRAAAAPA